MQQVKPLETPPVDILDTFSKPADYPFPLAVESHTTVTFSTRTSSTELSARKLQSAMDAWSAEPFSSLEEVDTAFGKDSWIPKSDHCEEETQWDQDAPSPVSTTADMAEEQCGSQQPLEDEPELPRTLENESPVSLLSDSETFDKSLLKQFSPFKAPVWGSGREQDTELDEKPAVPKRRRPPLRRLGHLSVSSPPPSPYQIIDGKASKFMEIFEPEPLAVTNNVQRKRSREAETPVAGLLWLNPALILNPAGVCSAGKSTWQGVLKGILRSSPAKTPSKPKAGQSVRFEESNETVEIEAVGSCCSTSHWNTTQRVKRRRMNLKCYEMRTGILPIDIAEDEESWEALKFSPSIWRHKPNHECDARDKQPPFYHLADDDSEKRLSKHKFRAPRPKEDSSRTRRSPSKKKVQVVGSESDFWEDVWKVAF